MASLILGITGKKRSGKDTFAARLVDAHGFTRIAFADALKASILDLDPLVRIEPDETGILREGDDVYFSRLGLVRYERLADVVSWVGWERAKEIREVRRLLQAHGVSIRDHVGLDVWVDAAARKAAEAPGPVCITDVRFPNEADSIVEQAGFLLRVTRPGLESTDTHISETALDGTAAHYEVSNDGTVADLHAKADAVVAELREDYWYLFG